MKLLKNIIPGLIIIIILALFCTQLQNNKEQLRHTVQFNKLYQTSHTPYPLQNFVYLDTYMSISSLEGEGSGQVINSASGIAVRGVRNKVYAMTAGHWCSVDPKEYIPTLAVINTLYPNFEIKMQRRVAFFGNFYPVEEVYSDLENDVCVVTFSSPYAYKVENIKPARNYPDIGERIYTASAPLGIYSHEMRLIFDGYFGGCKEDSIYCFYTISGVEGSSGSGVLNRRGELVSILDVSVVNFHEVTGGARLEVIKRMYDEYIR